MFWTDWGRHPALLRARMDGSIVTPIVTTDIKWPNGIAIDYDTSTIYWVDAWYQSMQSCDVNGLYRKTVIENSHGLLHHPFSIAVKGGHLYWSDWAVRSVFRADIPRRGATLGEVQNMVTIAMTEDLPYGFTVVDTQDDRLGGIQSMPCGCGLLS